MGKGTLAVLDPRLAQQVSACNFADMTLPGRRPVSWTEVRSAWQAQLRDPALTGPLSNRMAGCLDEVLGTEIDLAEFAQRMSARVLLPVAIDGLSAADASRVLDFIAIRSTLQTPAGPPPRRTVAWRTVRTHWPVVAIVRRELHARAAGRRPRRLDLLDPLAGDLLNSLGRYQATDSMLALLTALCGPPGGAVAGLLYELVAHPSLASALAAELGSADPAQGTGPSRATPLTARFIKEVLRLWTPQAFIERPVRKHIALPETELKPGDDYVLSPYLLHRDARYWKDPDVFDPDRWRPDSDRALAGGACYMPFGWPPRSCVGARLALAQLTALCQLMCTRYRIELTEPRGTTVKLISGPVPIGFRGRIVNSRDLVSEHAYRTFG